MICGKCNAIVPAGSKMCMHCGQVFESSPQPVEINTGQVAEPTNSPPEKSATAQGTPIEQKKV